MPSMREMQEYSIFTLYEMALASQGVAWLGKGLIKKELSDITLVSLESRSGSVEMDVAQYFRKAGSPEKAKAIFNIVAG